MSSVEKYDTENKIWEQVAPIQKARSTLSLTVLDGKLFAMGGFDGENFLNIVEVYDPETNAWTLGTPLTSGRSGHASAVIYQPVGNCQQSETIHINHVNHQRYRQHDEDRFDRGGPSSSNSNCGGFSDSRICHSNSSANGMYNCRRLSL